MEAGHGREGPEYVPWGCDGHFGGAQWLRFDMNIATARPTTYCRWERHMTGHLNQGTEQCRTGSLRPGRGADLAGGTDVPGARAAGTPRGRSAEEGCWWQ
ncbi:hypothetical protein Acsp03_10930 [Actinomadura sp. NBRC 104412]|nr:hypothetical protein Acsp03_10930 [Actinomadura sp. NBRC 104412]